VFGRKTDVAAQDTGTRDLVVLLLLGALLIGLCALLVAFYVRPPLGTSPRLGRDADLTGFFPSFWAFLPRTPDDVAFCWRAVGFWSLLSGTFLLALFWTDRAARGPSALRVVAGVSVVAHLLFVLAPPFLCNDLLRYAVFGRMLLGPGLNPYLSPPAALVGDPLLPYANLFHVTSGYGPSFMWFSALLGWLGRGDVFWTALLFKGAAAACSLVNCWLIRRLTLSLYGEALRPLVLYAWNPLVLLEIAGMGHNEALMVALALGGLLLASRGRPWLGFGLLVLSADVKQVTAVMALLFAVQFVAAAPHWRGRLRRMAGLLALAAAIELVLWAPFWAGPRTFAALETLFHPRVLVPGARSLEVGKALVFVAAVLAAAWKASRGGLKEATTLSALLMLAFVVFVFPWRFSWYVIPPLALLAVNAQNWRWMTAALVALVWASYAMIPYALVHL